MRQRLIIALCALGALTVMMGSMIPAGAAGDTKGPACANITDGTLNYDGTDVTADITLAKAACRSVTYTVYVLDAPGGNVIGQSSAPVASGTTLHFDVAAPTTPTTTCEDLSTGMEVPVSFVYAYATSSHGQHVADRAPDAGYVELPSTNLCGSPSRSFH